MPLRMIKLWMVGDLLRIPCWQGMWHAIIWFASKMVIRLTHDLWATQEQPTHRNFIDDDDLSIMLHKDNGFLVIYHAIFVQQWLEGVVPRKKARRFTSLSRSQGQDYFHSLYLIDVQSSYSDRNNNIGKNVYEPYKCQIK